MGSHNCTSASWLPALIALRERSKVQNQKQDTLPQTSSHIWEGDREIERESERKRETI